MSDVLAYAPPRDPVSKVRRRITQWRAARPAKLSFTCPVLTICFDDFPVSAAETGARILEAHGGRGTFFAAAGLMEEEGPCGQNFSPSHLTKLAAAGHEIGCHTFSHNDCAQLPAEDTLSDLARNRDALADMGGPMPVTLAYPYGETHRALKTTLPHRYIAARGILPGLNVDRVDLAQLRSYALFGAGGLAAVHAALQRAAASKAWVIAFTHDVSDSPSPWGTSSGDLADLLREAQAMGFNVLPMREAVVRGLGACA